MDPPARLARSLMRGRRPTVRGLMTAVAGSALVLTALLARRSWFHVVNYFLVVAGRSIHAWGPVLFLAFIFGPRLRGRIPRRVVRAFFGVSLVVSIYLLWTFFSITSDTWFDTPRGFPYRDRVLYALNEWFDARHPAPDGFIKLHWEGPRVTYVVGIVTILSLIASAFFGALLVRPRPSKIEA